MNTYFILFYSSSFSLEMLYRYIALAATHYRTVMQVWFGAYVPSQTNVGLSKQDSDYLSTHCCYPIPVIYTAAEDYGFQ